MQTLIIYDIIEVEGCVKMEKENKSQMIIVNRSPFDQSIQIVIPPFRPINLYELEDNFDEVVEEIEAQITDDLVAEQIVGFVGAFKDSLEEGDVLPIIDYFMQHDINTMKPQELIQVFESLKEFIQLANSTERILH